MLSNVSSMKPKYRPLCVSGKRSERSEVVETKRRQLTFEAMELFYEVSKSRGLPVTPRRLPKKSLVLGETVCEKAVLYFSEEIAPCCAP